MRFKEVGVKQISKDVVISDRHFKEILSNLLRYGVWYLYVNLVPGCHFNTTVILNKRGNNGSSGTVNFG